MPWDPQGRHFFVLSRVVQAQVVAKKVTLRASPVQEAPKLSSEQAKAKERAPPLRRSPSRGLLHPRSENMRSLALPSGRRTLERHRQTRKRLLVRS
jgi:hypothetical protein